MALIQQDLVPGSGDQLLTLDTDSNLQWLNLTVTAGRSYNEVMGGFGGFTTTHGFEYADGAQIGELCAHAGITKGLTEPAFTPSPNDAKNHYCTEALQNFMNGKTLIGSVVHSRGIMKPPAPPSNVSSSILGTLHTFLNLLDISASHTESEGPTADPQVGNPEIGFIW